MLARQGASSRAGRFSRGSSVVFGAFSVTAVRSTTPLPGAAAAQVVRICCKGPHRAGAPKGNRRYSALLLATDPGPGRLCNRFGHAPASGRPRSPTTRWFTPEGYSGVVLKTWSVKVVGDGLLGSPPGASGGRSGAAGSAGRVSGAVRAAAGEVPAPRPRFASITHLAWWDGVSHAVTRPGPRARHLTREHVCQSDVLAGQVTCSAVIRRSRGPRRPAPPRPGRRDAHSALENDGRTAVVVVQPHMNGQNRKAPP